MKQNRTKSASRVLASCAALHQQVCAETSAQTCNDLLDPYPRLRFKRKAKATPVQLHQLHLDISPRLSPHNKMEMRAGLMKKRKTRSSRIKRKKMKLN